MEREGTFVYVANGPGAISVFSLAIDSGQLNKVQDVALNDGADGSKGSRFMTMTMSPDSRFLYATRRAAPFTVSSFAVDGFSGRLTHLGTAPLVDSAPYLSTDNTGRYLFAAYNPADRKRRTGLVSVSAIRKGFVQPPHQVLRIGAKTHAIKIDASNRFVFAPCCNSDTVAAFAFDSDTGLLNRNVLAPLIVKPKSGPRHWAFHPNNRFAYLINETDASLYVYGFDPRDGSTCELQVAEGRRDDLDPDANVEAADLHITPDGKWIYAAVAMSNSLSVFGVDEKTGLVTPAGHFTVDLGPRGFCIDPFGRYLIANGVDTGTIVIHTIDRATGALTKVGTLADQFDPNAIEIVRLP